MPKEVATEMDVRKHKKNRRAVDKSHLCFLSCGRKIEHFLFRLSSPTDMSTSPIDSVSVVVGAVTATEALRKSINAIPISKYGNYMGRPLKNTGDVLNPCRIASQGFAVLVCQFIDNTVLIQVVDAATMRESGQCEATLEQLGIPTYQKLLKGLDRGSVYRKGRVLHMSALRKNNEPWGAVALTPMTDAQCFSVRSSAKLNV